MERAVASFIKLIAVVYHFLILRFVKTSTDLLQHWNLILDVHKCKWNSCPYVKVFPT